MGRPAGSRQQVTADALGVAAVMLLSAAPYVARLGFYSDDWGLLANLGQGWSLADTLRAFAARPLNGLAFYAMFDAFGLAPLGYHLVNTAVLTAGIVLFHLLLVRLRVDRRLALASALLLIVLPQLSTVRVWPSAAQIPLAMALALASMHFQLSFARSRRALWAIAAAVTAVLSLAAYELFVPLIVGFALALAVAHARRGSERRWRAAAAAGLIVGGFLAGALLFKIAASSREGAIADLSRYAAGARQLIRPDYDWRFDSSLNLFAALDVHFWRPLAGWASAATQLVDGSVGVPVLAAAAGAAGVGWWSLSAGPAGAPPRGRDLRDLLLLGGATFILGHAVFLIVPAIVFTPTGVGNRVLVAAALGVAMLYSGVAALVLSSRLAFAALVTAILFLGVVRVNGVVRYWTEAPALQQAALAAAKIDLRPIPAGSTVILDGVCPYHGPAVVFEAPWDVGGALSIALGRPVAGDAVSERMKLGPDGVETSIYKAPALYPYGPRLYAYDPRTHRVVRLASLADALIYVRTRTPLRCPRGYVARGVPV